MCQELNKAIVLTCEKEYGGIKIARVTFENNVGGGTS